MCDPVVPDTDNLKIGWMPVITVVLGVLGRQDTVLPFIPTHPAPFFFLPFLADVGRSGAADEAPYRSAKDRIAGMHRVA